MSLCLHPNITEADSAADIQAMKPSDAGDLFTRQTGQVLLELGSMFLYIPPFNEHVDRKTADLLISIGNKLRTQE
ncbi:MAG TPA: hypothetical protein VK897_22425 [Anaerolineales bacterium]|nr:hypothetical protein [Anaerolineales bacterium]